MSSLSPLKIIAVILVYGPRKSPRFSKPSLE
jgi:hypothetical protein